MMRSEVCSGSYHCRDEASGKDLVRLPKWVAIACFDMRRFPTKLCSCLKILIDLVEYSFCLVVQNLHMHI
jgi:hypothetical protein